MLHTANRNKTKLVELAVNCDNGDNLHNDIE